MKGSFPKCLKNAVQAADNEPDSPDWLVATRYAMGGEGRAPLAGTVTRLIGRIDAGDEPARAEFCELVYDELRAIGRRMRRQISGCSLATTDVVHEFFGGFLAKGHLGRMKNRRYFYWVAADQMRCLLIDHWRHKRTRADGRLKREELDPWLDELGDSAAARCGGDLEALDEALTHLKAERPRQHEVFVLKFFGGMTNAQAAEAIGMSIDTVKRDWDIARARLKAYLGEDDS